MGKRLAIADIEIFFLNLHPNNEFFQFHALLSADYGGGIYVLRHDIQPQNGPTARHKNCGYAMLAYIASGFQ